MIKTHTPDAIEFSRTFVDVLYLSSKRRIHCSIKQLFKDKELSFFVAKIDDFKNISDYLDKIGTVIIDVSDIDQSKKSKLPSVVEVLERNRIGVIMICSNDLANVKSFVPSRTKSFCLSRNANKLLLEELWFRINVNLSKRGQNGDFFVNGSSVVDKQRTIFSNKLEEQFKVTGALVDNLSEQLRLAGLVQQDFLPNQYPDSDKIKWAANFMPAEWVSGDIYDITRLDENHIGFYIVDVVGHSMPAALLTIFIKQALQMRKTTGNTYKIFSPSEVLKNLNRKMTAQKLSGYQFATCCYCLLNTQTLKLTYARAGHPYPVLLRPGEDPKQLEVRGSLLGIFEQAQYAEDSIQLEPGDKIVLYSDGAEPFMGDFNEAKGFHFNDQFLLYKELPIKEMFENLIFVFGNSKLSPSEIDDISTVGLEILR